MKKTLQQVFFAIAVVAVATSCATHRAQSLPDGEEPQVNYQVPAQGARDITFNGSVRKQAKLTMTPAMNVSFFTIEAVTCNGTTAAPPAGCNITVPNVVWAQTTLRQGDELKLAMFDAYIYAWNMPTDGDFHVIVGDTATFSTSTNLINIEISALPGTFFSTLQPPLLSTLAEVQLNHDFATLRETFMGKVGVWPYGTVPSGYKCENLKPIAIKVWGGPFWDYQHANPNPNKPIGTKSCTDAKGAPIALTVKNGWEIHPVTHIQ
jgi:hypothetical protein